MTRNSVSMAALTVLLHAVYVFGQCTFCTRDQGCCMDRMNGQWYCCVGNALTSSTQQQPPWNFDMQIKYDVFRWNCNPSNVNPAEMYTNVSCILDGRWSLDRLTFQLTSIPSNDLQSIQAEYTMKDGSKTIVEFQAVSQWALTLPVDKNLQPGTWNIYDKIKFTYNGHNYTYSFGYGSTPHCPRC